jgi:alanine racemase
LSTTKYRTWIEVSKKAIKQNVRNVLAKVSEKQLYMGMVKGNAWGLGTVDFAKTLVEAGADWIGVTLIEDALAVRKEIAEIPILILMEYPYSQIEEALKNKIKTTICTKQMAQQVSATAAKLGYTADVHIKINTGLNRIGVSLNGAVEFVKYVHTLPNICLDGVFTHFSSADNLENKEITRKQLAAFLEIIQELKGEGIAFNVLHTSNSPASIDFPETYLDLVRPGMSIAGLYPSNYFRNIIKLSFPMTWKAGISYIRKVAAGETVGYGGKYLCEKDCTIVTIPVGTADGLGKRFEGNGFVLIKGKPRKVIAVTMDQAMIQLDGQEEVNIGDEVVILGKQLDGYLGPHEVAEHTGYNVEELVCQISYRIPRIYIE